MLAPWAKEEMELADLEDKRLNERLVKLLSAFGERPNVSIPAACGGYAEMIAAYRFFDNDNATPEKILASHFVKTRQRMAEHPVVLLTQDTTELDFTRPQQQVAGAGLLDGSSRHGALAHPLMAFTPDGVPLGSLAVEMWTRDEVPDEAREEDHAEGDHAEGDHAEGDHAEEDHTEESSAKLREQERQRKRKATPIEDKESFRWLTGLRKAREVAQGLPATTCVCMADSEGDIYELFAEPRGVVPLHWLIRSCHDRALLPKNKKTTRMPTVEVAADAPANDDAASDDARSIYAQAGLAPVLFTNKISVRGRESLVSCETRGRRQPRTSRETEVEVRATTVTLRPPWRPDRKLAVVQINVVWVREINPPDDDQPVDWLLMTTLPIDTPEQVRQIIQYYATRFLIEVFFRVLKSGCRVEERRFEHIDRMLTCVAVYMIVAWRTLMLCRLGHSCPDLDCETIFEPAEWKAVWSVTQRTPLPTTPPRLGVMVRLVAQLGGYVNRPNRKDPPGPQTVWLGMQRTRDLAWAWTTFGPEASSAGVPIEDHELV